MKEFDYFLTHMSKDMKRIVTSGVRLEKVDTNIKTFLDYVEGDFKTQLGLYKGMIPNMDSIQLETKIESQYKFLLKGTDLRACVDFVEGLIQNMDDFKGNENTLHVLIGVYMMYFAFVVKLVDAYLGALASYSAQGQDVANFKMSDIGIDNSVLKYYKLIEELRAKTLDEWKKVTCNDSESRYILSAIKRVLLIYGY